MTVAMLLVNTLKAANVAAMERRQIRQMSVLSKVPSGVYARETGQKSDL